MKNKKEKFMIALIVIGIVVILAGVVIPRFIELPLASIICYIVGSILVLAGLIWYFVDYYKVKDYSAPNSTDYESYLNNEKNTQDYQTTDIASAENEQSKFATDDQAIGSMSDSQSVKSMTLEEYEASQKSNGGNQSTNDTEPSLTNTVFNQMGFDDFDDYKKSTKTNMKIFTPLQKVEWVLVMTFIITGFGSILLGKFMFEDTNLGFGLIIYGLVAFLGSVLFEIFRTVISRKIIFTRLKKGASAYADKCNLVEGVVLSCSLHSSVSSNVKKFNGNNIYNIAVKINNYNASVNGKKDMVVMQSLNRYKEGTPVRFYQDKVKPKKCYLIEN